MLGRHFDIRRESGYGGNCIPSGRQLPRTPPLTDVKRHLDFSRDDSNMEVRVDIVRSLLQFIKLYCVMYKKSFPNRTATRKRRLMPVILGLKQVTVNTVKCDQQYELFSLYTEPLYCLITSEPRDHAMLKGMKGYQLTESDLEFINKMQEEKLIKKLQVIWGWVVKKTKQKNPIMSAC